ncbi:protein kinase domain-containing protein [Agromyces bracchium]|uniref:non-specific serine/threonine protein kinase n=1 Tax=Agromyces bracchium TaxID=88376 RepID=A0A6I3M5E2_9MICO|nr:serine/threonine-protein kinase [Agromyces bracchium]MTH69840.1 protein kinase [Agromyces bracchium]
MTAGLNPTVAPWVAILTGQNFGPYTLERFLGAGTFGLVFEAVNHSTNGRFAVKVLIPGANAEAILDFQNEGILLQQLNSCEGVIGYVDGDVHHIDMCTGIAGVIVPMAVHYHVLTMASGSLDELISNPVARARLGWIEKLKIWRSAVKALHQMHLRAVAHRDLKSSNCLLMIRQNQTHARWADLGRAKDMRSPASRAPVEYLHGRGDMRFAPPEYLYLQGGSAAEDFIAADYYGLGSLLVELISGHPMSSLALGDIRAILTEAELDLIAGRRRDLSSLDLKFRKVIADLVEVLPRSIQVDVKVLLSTLCHPVAKARLTRSPYRRDRLNRDGLEWILRRVDILIKRLEIEHRAAARSNNRLEVSA